MTNYLVHTCDNCGEEFIIRHLDNRVGHEGATSGVYQGGENYMYSPRTDTLHPFCPECEFVDVDTIIEESS